MVFISFCFIHVRKLTAQIIKNENKTVEQITSNPNIKQKSNQKVKNMRYLEIIPY